MQLRTLGNLKLEFSDFSRPKPLLLLAFLAVEGTKERRHVQELFWSEAADRALSLRVALSQLRQISPDIILSEGQRIGLSLKSDVAAFLQAIRDGDLVAARDLYSGAFLDGFSLPDWGVELEEWVLNTRDALASQARATCLKLAERDFALGKLETAVRFAEDAYRLAGTAHPEELERLHTILQASDSPLVFAVRDEARDFGLELKIVQPKLKMLVPPAPYRLPTPRTSFFGRDLERLELSRALAEGTERLLTLLGSGGMGKTRLALQLAFDQMAEQSFAGGIYFIPLETATTLDQAVQAISSVLGLMPSPKPLEVLFERIGQSKVLLVLDNFEQLLTEGNDAVLLIPKLLNTCPHLKILVTSRERLELEEEFVWSLSGLSVSETNSSDAVLLFAERAKRARLDFALTETDLTDVVQICTLLNGAPLAIELATAWIRTMSPKQIIAALLEGFDLLETGLRNVPERHRSLKMVFEHSWNLLGAQHQLILSQLAVFEGGFQHQAAQIITGSSLTMLGSLFDKSLVFRVADGRYELHAFIRQYAHEKLEAQTDVLLETQVRHAQFYLDFAEQAAKQLNTPEAASWCDRLEQEHANILVALRFYTGNAESLSRLVCALTEFWQIRGYFSESKAWLSQALTLKVTSSRMQILDALGTVELHQGNYEMATLHFKNALELARDSKNVSAQGTALYGLAAIALDQGQYATARETASESLNLQQGIQNQVGTAQSLGILGRIASDQNDYARAKPLLEQALRLWRSLNDTRGIAGVLILLTAIAVDQGDFSKAKTMLEESLERRLALGDKRGASIALGNLGHIAMNLGNYAEARALRLQSLEQRRELGDKRGVAYALNDLGLIALKENDFELASSYSQQALEIRRSLFDTRGISSTTQNLGSIAIQKHEYALAMVYLKESLETAFAISDRLSATVSIEQLGNIAVAQNNTTRAAKLFAAAAAARSSLNTPLTPASQGDHAAKLESIRQSDPIAFETAWATGQTWNLEQASQFGLVLEPELVKKI
jgi:predicted ATPase/Tfp pilus assembly protein PilF